ncbi:hypothetical protein M514_03309 [Trichuris suis]|uniref:Uncharacterized protein n=1 Tax=Trichuris suis TaxID=68888 RepID=A0A085MF74_9BILA|nr:hypothetical protein M513_03309 [Trichuris suis]KFD70214.1 hypothetical protein M514_03309 [Trichuris suis]
MQLDDRREKRTQRPKSSRHAAVACHRRIGYAEYREPIAVRQTKTKRLRNSGQLPSSTPSDEFEKFTKQPNTTTTSAAQVN